MNKVIILFCSCFTAIVTSCSSGPVEYKDGDIIFHRSTTNQAKALYHATGSKYTHMGIIFIESGKPYVYEAVQPVKRTPLKSWIDRGKEGHFVVKRLKDAEKVLTPKKIKVLKAETKKFLGKDYDLPFGWSDNKIYCSELVWKAYKRTLNIEIGKLKKLKDFDLSHPSVKRLMHKRYGDKVPLEETVISPSDMFHSANLRSIHRN